MGYLSTDKKKITTKTFAEMKAAGEKVTMLTAYDFTTAGILDAAGIDSILIGDSASNVMAGNADTLPIMPAAWPVPASMPLWYAICHSAVIRSARKRRSAMRAAS